MGDRKINPVGRRAVLRGELEAVASKGVAHVYLERVEGRLLDDHIAEVGGGRPDCGGNVRGPARRVALIPS
jgi:hypothetical protein